MSFIQKYLTYLAHFFRLNRTHALYKRAKKAGFMAEQHITVNGTKDNQATSEVEVKQKQTTSEKETAPSKETKQDTQSTEEPKTILASVHQKLKQQLAELQDKFLRSRAEFDNFRRRTAKERIELTKTANRKVVTALLPVLDDFERAFQANEKSETPKDVEGFKLIYDKLQNTLITEGLKPMENNIGKDFDINYHEAMAQIPAPSEDLKDKVIDEIEKGYYLGDKIIRYAKVVVGK